MTGQIHELLILDGEECSMTYCPPFPTNHQRIVTAQAITNRPESDLHSLMLTSTACWRGYQGTWVIRDNFFYLKTLHGCWQVTSDEPLLADWFSGVIRIPRGKQMTYVHMGFGSVYEEELHIRIDAGQVMRRQVINNRDKSIDEDRLALENLPGFENRFAGDDLK